MSGAASSLYELEKEVARAEHRAVRRTLVVTITPALIAVAAMSAWWFSLQEAREQARSAQQNTKIAQAQARDTEAQFTYQKTQLADADARLKATEMQLADAQARIKNTDGGVKAIETRLAEAQERVKDANLRLAQQNTQLVDAENRLKDALAAAQGGCGHNYLEGTFGTRSADGNQWYFEIDLSMRTLEGRYVPRGDVKNAAIRPGAVCQAGVFEMKETLGNPNKCTYKGNINGTVVRGVANCDSGSLRDTPFDFKFIDGAPGARPR
jgi:hypothetical protein